MKITLVFKDALLPKKINFQAKDITEPEKIRNEAHRLLRERLPECKKRKFDVSWTY